MYKENLRVKMRLKTIFIVAGLMIMSFMQLSYANLAESELLVLDDLLSEGLISQQEYNAKSQLFYSQLFEQQQPRNNSSIAGLQKGSNFGSISGNITDENGNPIEFITVRLVNAISLTSTVASVQTDALGDFSFTGLDAGNYVIFVFGNGYLKYVWQSSASGGPRLCSGCTKTITADNYISVAAAQSVTGIDVSTQLGGVVTGFIRDTDSQLGVTTLTAILYNLADGSYATATSTVDVSTGEYTIDSVPNGTYKLYLVNNSIYKNNQHIPQLYASPNIECNNCKSLISQGLGEDLLISSFNTINNVNFDLNIGASFSGKIVDATTGNPLPNVSLLQVFDELNYLLFTNVLAGTDATPTSTGDYTIGGLLPGSYYVQGGDLGRNFYQREVYANKPCYWSGCDRSIGDPVVLSSKQVVTGVDFLLDKGGKISGTVTNASTGLPIDDANVQVQFLDANEVVVGGARVRTNGTYVSARALPPGNYAVRTGNLFVGALTQPYVNEKYNDIECSGLACDLTTADVNVVSDTITPNIDFSLTTGQSFSGTITEFGTGNPIPDVHVLVYKDMGNGTVKFANWATTNDGSTAAIGSFVVTGLPYGTYYAVTNNGSNLPFMGFSSSLGLGWLDILYDGMLCPATGCDILSGTPIVLTNTKSANNVLNISMQQGATISGNVIDDVLNVPIIDIQINIYNQAGEFYGSYTTDTFGHYQSAGLPADTYYLTTSSFDVLIDMAYGNKPCFSGTCNYQDAQPITLSNQQNKTGIDFVLIPTSDFVFMADFEN